MKMLSKAEEAAADVLGAFESPSELPRPLAQVFIHRKDGSPCREWSWRNQLIVAIRGHCEARGYRQWEQVGRRVKTGGKAFRILSPFAKKIVDENTQEERTAVYGFKGTPVFGYDQTEGEPLPNRDLDLQRWLDSLPLLEVAKAWGLSVEAYNGQGGGYLGAYRHGRGIALGVENLSTWCHELVHAADDRNGKLKGAKVSREIVAALGKAVLLQILGYEHEADLGGCWEYIRSYAGEEKIDVLAACGRVLDRTCEAVALILDTAEQLWASSPESEPRGAAVVAEEP